MINKLMMLAMVLGLVTTGCVAAIDSPSDGQMIPVRDPAPTCESFDTATYQAFPCKGTDVSYDSSGSLCVFCHNVTVPADGGCAIRVKATGMPQDMLCVSTQAQCDSDCHPKP